MSTDFIHLVNPGITSNDSTNSCCFHACIHLILHGCGISEVPDFVEIDRILERKPGQYSWVYAMYSYLAKREVTFFKRV